MIEEIWILKIGLSISDVSYAVSREQNSHKNIHIL